VALYCPGNRRTNMVQEMNTASTKPKSKGDEGFLVCLFQLGIPVSAFTLMYLMQRFAAHFGSAVFAATTVTVAAVCVGTIAFFLARHASLRGRILAVVVGYVTLVFFYGAVYHFQFQRRPDAFLVNTEGKEGKALQVFDDTYNSVREYNRRLYYLSLLEAHPQAGASAVTNSGRNVSIDTTHTVKYSILWGSYNTTIFFNVYEDEVEVLDYDTTNPIDPITPLIGGLSHGKDAEAFLHRLRALIDHQESERNRLLAELKRAVSGDMPWDFLDFVYFSSVTMTTLGYGDIVPNARLTRLTVMSQAILGICYLGFSLMFIWPRDNQGTA